MLDAADYTRAERALEPAPNKLYTFQNYSECFRHQLKTSRVLPG